MPAPQPARAARSRRWPALLLVLAALTAAACAPIAPGPALQPTAEPGAAAAADRANLVESGDLRRTQAIEIGVFNPTSALPYPAAATVTDPAGVERFIEVLDQPLALGPAAACLDAYRLRFTLDDGSVREIGFACEGEPAVLRAEFGGLQGRSLPAPADLAALVAAHTQAR